MSVNKEDIQQACIQHLNAKIEELSNAIESAQNSANSETKSSAGDKHETSRAMAQNERDRLAKQLNGLVLQRNAINQLDTGSHESVQSGSYVVTKNGAFYVSVGLGLVDKQFFAISLNTPVGQALNGKRQGEYFTFNGNQVEIVELY